MARFDDILNRKSREYGDKYDPSELASAFVPYFNSGERIKVHVWGQDMTGTVGITTGWKPSFLLMRTSRSRGSSILLGKDTDRVLAVKRDRSYMEIR